jgi:hypothetical protein
VIWPVRHASAVGGVQAEVILEGKYVINLPVAPVTARIGLDRRLASQIQRDYRSMPGQPVRRLSVPGT